MSKNFLVANNEITINDIPFLFSLIDSLTVLSKRVPESKVFTDSLPVSEYETTAGLPLYVFVRIIYNKYFGKPDFKAGDGYKWEGIMVNGQPIGGLKLIYDRLNVKVPDDEPYLMYIGINALLPAILRYQI
jgi:hypothetical protein